MARITSRRPGLVVGVSALLALVSIGGILRLRVDTNHINFFSAGHPLSQSARLIDGKLSGVYGFQVFFEGPAESMRDPAVLGRIDALGKAIGKLPNVRSVISLADYVKRIDRDLGGDRRRYRAGVVRPHRPGALRLRALGRGPARAVADRRQRLLARAR